MVRLTKLRKTSYGKIHSKEVQFLGKNIYRYIFQTLLTDLLLQTSIFGFLDTKYYKIINQLLLISKIFIYQLRKDKKLAFHILFTFNFESKKYRRRIKLSQYLKKRQNFLKIGKTLS